MHDPVRSCVSVGASGTAYRTARRSTASGALFEEEREGTPAAHPLRSWLTCVVACGSCVAAACISASEPVEVVKWQAALVASGATLPFTGSVAMVIGQLQTDMGVSVQDAPPEATLGWAIVEGTCGSPGARVGPSSAYPAIAVSGGGSGSSDTVLHRRIATSGPYAGIVYEGEDGTGAALACADLERRE